MPDRHCCPECFGDAGLTRSIIPMVVAANPHVPSKRSCDYCKSRGSVFIPPASLRQWFEIVLDCYAPDPTGQSLVKWLRQDWNLFGHENMDDAHAKDLLGDILDDGQIVRECFSPVESLTAEDPQLWDDLRDEMMHRNRWFLDDPIDLDRLGDLLDQLIVHPGEMPETWYRARLLTGDSPYELDEMGAPPSRLAGHGRANPAGIRYLYLGSEPGTAVAEVRPHTGERVCVAEFSVPPMRFVDLRSPRSRVSPFILEDVEQISRVRDGLPLLERLGLELTKPVQPMSAAYEYIPSQYLCEFVKKRGFEGVIFRSSVSDGINLALFDPDTASAVRVDTLIVSRVSVDIAPCS